MRRWISVPSRAPFRLGRGARPPLRSAAATHAASRAMPLDARRVGQRATLGEVEQQLRGRHRGARPRHPPARRRHPLDVGSGRDRIAEAASSASPSKSSSAISVGGTRLDELAGVGRLVRRGVGIRHDDHRQADRRRLGERRRAGTPDEQVGRDDRLGHLVAQERVRPVALATARPGSASRRRSASA